MNNYRVVTISNRTPNEWYYRPDLWRKSLGGVEPLIIDGVGYEKWGGMAQKVKWLYRAIKENRIPEKRIIYCDSWDIVFAAHPDEIITRWVEAGGDKLIVNAEKNCFPTALKDDFDKLKSPTKYKYLNSGFVVGETEMLLACLESMDLQNVPDDYFDAERGCNVHFEDQTLMQKEFLKQVAPIALDYHCTFSQTLHEADESEFDFSEERVKNTYTNSYPCCFHGNGSGKSSELFNKILNHLKLL